MCEGALGVDTVLLKQEKFRFVINVHIIKVHYLRLVGPGKGGHRGVGICCSVFIKVSQQMPHSRFGSASKMASKNGSNRSDSASCVSNF